MSQECVFCRIVNKQIPSVTVAENNDILVIKDIHPRAPVHYLILPKRHIGDFRDFSSEDTKLVADMVLMANQLSKTLHNADYRLVINNGYSSGQRVFHSHIHFLSGKEMVDF